MEIQKNLMKSMIVKSKTSGFLLALAGLVIVIGLHLSQFFYPLQYDALKNEISDLGASNVLEAPEFQVSQLIFSTSLFISGILILSSAIIMLQKSMIPISIAL